MVDYESTPDCQCITDSAIDWIKILTFQSSELLCFSEVKYSMSCYSTTFKCWTLERSGNVLGGWCSCDEGFTQSCSHAGALLFPLEYDHICNVISD